jgi:hypothetical protein
MTRRSYFAVICFLLVPIFASAQDRQEPNGAGAASHPTDWRTFARDPGFEGGVWGGIIGGALGFLGAVLTVYWMSKTSRKDNRRQTVRELKKEFIYGSMLRSRLNAELLLCYDVGNRFSGKNFEDMYTDHALIAKEDYADVAVVLNLFRLLDDYKNAGHIDEVEARKEFGWIYTFWWEKVISVHSAGLENNPDWGPHIKRRDWLLVVDRPAAVAIISWKDLCKFLSGCLVIGGLFQLNILLAGFSMPIFRTRLREDPETSVIILIATIVMLIVCGYIGFFKRR